MYRVLNYLIDFIFPPRKTELEIRYLKPEELYKKSNGFIKTEFPFIKAIFPYKDELIRELIWQIKYKKNKNAIKCAGFALYNKIKIIESDYIKIIPIPISKQRRKDRGYNQCELIIDEIIRIYDLDNEKNKTIEKDYKLLTRVRDIEKQTLKNRNERIENTKHIFKVTNDKQEDYNKKILIIDDVSTTGSTLKEAREILFESGYKDVEALVIAH